MFRPYLYQSEYSNYDATHAVLVLPEIFGVNAHIRSVADRFADEMKVPAFALDFFYPLTKSPNDFAYDEAGMQKGMELMHLATGEAFDAVFHSAVEDMRTALPQLQHIIVTGFCMGGRLAFAAAKEPLVKTIYSLYGARAHQPFYADGTSTIQVLLTHHNPDLVVHGFYGIQDPSIPEEDRAQTIQLLQEAGVAYHEHLFDAGHAFFNDARPTYVPGAAAQAWEIIHDAFPKS